jgi:hypothetical protein
MEQKQPQLTSEHWRSHFHPREWLDLLDTTDAAKLIDIQRAARYLYLAKNCYAIVNRFLYWNASVLTG